LRWASYEYERAETQGGFFATYDANGVFAAPARTTEEDVLLPRFNVTYEPTDNTLYYVQAAEGFRVGRVNLPLPLTCEGELNAIGLTTGVNPGLDPVPASADSDSLWSYEAGAKFSGSRHTLNLATYYLDWSDIQSQFLGGCGFEFFYNGGSASITGVELEFSADITDGLSVGIAASYNDAQLEEDATLGTSVQGASGDRLPGVPQWDVRANARYEWDIASDLMGYVRADWSYTGDYLSAFPSDSFQSGDYEIANAAIGLETPTVNIQLFADNLLDERAQLSGNDTSFAFSPRLTIGRPRTVGIRLSVQR
jgi:iron complex outermembrane receptor protein